MDTLLHDLRYGLRLLLKRPTFTLIAALTLALGVGANTAIFSVVNAVLLRPLAFQQPDRVMLVTELWRNFRGNVSAGNYVDWAAEQKGFEKVAALQTSSFNLSTGESPERIPGARVTAGYFPLFGVAPLVGRTFSEAEDQPGREQVVVLSEPLWRERFGADRSVLGRSVQLDGRPYQVIGVMPQSFDPILNAERMWVPIAFTAQRRATHDEHYLIIFGRLKAGVTREQAQAEASLIAKRIEERFPRDDQGRGIAITPLLEILVGDSRSTLLMLLGAVGFVLLIACANVANLQLARARSRRREIAIRAALGAAPGRIVRQLLVESMMLGGLGGAMGVLLANWGVAWIVAAGPSSVPRLHETQLDSTTLLFALIVSVFAGLLFGLAPALRSGAVSVAEAFKDGRSAAPGGARDHVRSALVVSQVALALMLLVGAGLLVRSIALARRSDPGFDPSGVLAGRIALPQPRYRDPSQVRLTFEGMLEQVRAVAGVESAALVSTTPFNGGSSNGLVPEGKPLEAASAVLSRIRLVSPQYFATVRVPLKRGRLFSERDDNAAPRVMVVNETLAQAAFPGQDPLGKRIACCESMPDGKPVWKEIVGVVGDVRAWGITQSIQPEFYLPVAQAPNDSWSWFQQTMDVVVRTPGDPMSVTTGLRRAVASVDAGVPLYNVSTMQQRVSGSLAQSSFDTVLLAIFAATALLLASIGIYGVLSYSVALRTHEIGIRMAMGAQRSDVMRLVVGHGFRLTLLGVVLGLAGALATSRLLQNMLYAVRPTDPVTFIAVAVLLIAVALVAAYLPARRATRVDPMVALRYE